MAAGQDPSHFWDKTLRIIFTVLEGCAERRRREHNDRAWQTHQTAYLTKYAPNKPTEFIKLSKLQIKSAKPERRVRSWEDDFAALSAWAARGKPH